MGHDLRISVLGDFDVSLDGRAVPDDAWRRNRARALVKLLALASGHRLHREQLIDALWPELGPDAGASNLRKAVHFARRAIGAEHVRSVGEAVLLEAPILSIDVEAFESAIREGRRSEALALYRGDLLPGDRFEPWAEDLRDRLRLQAHRLLLEEAAALEHAGNLDAAVDVLERLVTSDPLHEEAHIALVRVLAASGARHVALARFRQFSDRLRMELDVEPDASLRQLADDIMSGRFGSGPDPRGVVDQARPDAEPALGSEVELRIVTVVSAAADRGEGSSGPGAEAWGASVAAIVRGWGGQGELQAHDEFLAVFGVPAAHEDDPTRALRASMEILKLTPAVRVGVATGEAVTVSGPESAFHRTSGAALLEAAGLREVAKPGSVLVSERARLASLTGFRYAAPESAGIDERTGSAHRLLDDAPGPSRPARPETPLVGRDAELAVVLGMFDDAVANARPRIVELLGPAGVGKSRLAAEVSHRIAERWPGSAIFRGRCEPGGRGAAFDALGEILRDVCGIGITDAAGDARAKLRRHLAAVLADLEPIDAEPTTFALAITAGIGLPGNPLDGLPPAELSDRVALAWSILASACAAAAPTVFLLEDLQWARPELLELIERMVSRAQGPLLVVATARPELHEAAPGFGLRDFSTIAIRPLGEVHSEQLLQSLVSGAELDDRTRMDLLAHAEGNPFYIEQLIHHLRSGGSGALPDTLQTLLTARLDSLSGAERRVLQEASVVGRVFWEAPLTVVLERERVGARLVSLERSGFVVRRATSSLPGQSEYWISHALLHDVAYASLPRARRARSHAATGAWLEALVGDRVEEVIDLLAHHYWSALAANVPQLGPDDGIAREEIRAKAFEFLLRAGGAARRRFVTERAIELHRRALDVASTLDERITALEALAWDHEDAFHGDDAAHWYREALELARADPDRAGDRARICRRLAWLMAWNPGAFRKNPLAQEVEALVDEGMAQAVDPGEQTWLLLVRGATARLYRGSEPLGQGSTMDPRPLGDRLAAAERALSQAREHGQEDVVKAAEHVLGMLYGLAANYDDMLDLARRQVAALRPEDSRLDQSDAIRKLAIHLINVRADFEAGLELGWRCRALLGSSAAGGPHQLMHTLWPILASLFFLGRWDELTVAADEHARAFRMEPAKECQFVRDGPAIGAAMLALRGHIAEANALAGLLGDPLADRASASAWEARLALFRGDPETARAIAHDKAVEGRVYGPHHAAVLLDALAAVEEWDSVTAFLPIARGSLAGNALIGPTADRVEGLAILASGEATRAARLIRRSIGGFRRLHVPFEEARSLEALGRALPTTGAESARTAASAIYRRLGVRTVAGGATVPVIAIG